MTETEITVLMGPAVDWAGRVQSVPALLAVNGWVRTSRGVERQMDD